MSEDKLYTFKHPLFWVSLILFLINQILERIYGVYIPFIHAYLDDLLCMPIVLGIATQILQWIHPAGNFYYLSKSHIAIAIVIFSVIFEGVLPITDPANFTSDFLDIGFYIVGALIFYRLIARKSKKQWEERVNHKK
ncbi:magnesium citrate secondary transporter [Marivirga sp. S37H4]|uniref:Magnesium citrate secondary transporter n=1 Tax=Marivirga aurantiaca TaxID=2802615 RepID=A0A935C5A4_9BACT|nr:magnesium citrate secondary transporter [Marivirga aurantiaca]MBK6263695.1 magnesium citrate secondary transporter [Marivirga aurantiaca]